MVRKKIITFFDKSLLGMTSVVFTILFGRSYLNYQVKLAELKAVISEKEALNIEIVELKQELIFLSSKIKDIPVSSVPSNEQLVILGLILIVGIVFIVPLPGLKTNITTIAGMDSQGNEIVAKLVGDPGIMQIFFGGYTEEILVGNLLLGCKYLRLGKANYEALVIRCAEQATKLEEYNAKMDSYDAIIEGFRGEIENRAEIQEMLTSAMRIIVHEHPELLKRFAELQALFAAI